MGTLNMAATSPPRRRRRPRTRISSLPAWAMTTICAPVTLGPDGAFSTMKKGAVFVDNTNCFGPRSRASSMPRRRPAALASSTRQSRAARRGAENGQLTVMWRRRPGNLRRGQACHRFLCADGGTDGSGRRWPVDQDGQPDLHCRAAAGSCRKAFTSARRRVSTSKR